MSVNRDLPEKPNIETIKRLLLEDLKNSSHNGTNRFDSTFCEIDDEPQSKIEVNRTYSRPTPKKRILKSLENTFCSPRILTKAIQKQKRKRTEEQENDIANESIVEISEQFKKVEQFQLAVE